MIHLSLGDGILMLQRPQSNTHNFQDIKHQCTFGCSLLDTTATELKLCRWETQLRLLRTSYRSPIQCLCVNIPFGSCLSPVSQYGFSRNPTVTGGHLNGKKLSRNTYGILILHYRQIYCRTDSFKVHLRFPADQTDQPKKRHWGNTDERFAPRAVITGLVSCLKRCSPDWMRKTQRGNPDAAAVSAASDTFCRSFTSESHPTHCFQSRRRLRLTAELLWPVCGIQFTFSVGK